MRTRVRKFAHLLERLGLAMAGAASGLFVGAHVGSSINAFTSQGFILLMMLGGAIGFYLGIDTPPLPFQSPADQSPRGRIDAAELMSAVGTFLAALAAFVSVFVILIRSEPHISFTSAILAGWTVGVVMQIVAGTIARMRA
jgi:hypothetical protein